MAIAKHGDVNKIAFTGSTVTGKKVWNMCGEGLKRCALELGGKVSPRSLPYWFPVTGCRRLWYPLGSAFNGRKMRGPYCCFKEDNVRGVTSLPDILWKCQDGKYNI